MGIADVYDQCEPGFMGRQLRLNMRITLALMWLSMCIISFHVPQAKEPILLYKFPACTKQASLTVDPASPSGSTIRSKTEKE
jgi:hypothetical protein